MKNARALPFLPLPLLLSLLLAAAVAAQNTPAPYQRALQRASADTQQRLERDLSLWSDHSTWEQAWVVRTEHFAVRTTSSHGTALDLAHGLEAMLANIQATLAIDRTPTERLQVHVFPDLAAYNQFGNQFGEHHSSFYGSFYAPGNDQRPVAALWSDNPTLLRMQITHSVVHQYLGAVYPATPRATWLEEGLAAYFATWWAYDWTLSEYERLLAADLLPPLPQLLRSDLAAYATDTHARFTELGMMFYWLLRYRADTCTPADAASPAPFRDYVKALLEGTPTDGAHCAALLADPAQLERDLRAFTFPR